MEFAAALPLLTACLLFRLGILSVWYCAAIASLGPIVSSLGYFFIATDHRLPRMILALLVTTAIVYACAVLFLLCVPAFHLLWYTCVFLVVNYLVMISSLTLIMLGTGNAGNTGDQPSGETGEPFESE